MGKTIEELSIELDQKLKNVHTAPYVTNAALEICGLQSELTAKQYKAVERPVTDDALVCIEDAIAALETAEMDVESAVDLLDEASKLLSSLR